MEAPIIELAGHDEATLEEMRRALDALPFLDRHREPEPLDDLLRMMREWTTERYEAHAAEPDYDLPPMFDFTGRRGGIPLCAPFNGDEEKEFVLTKLAPLCMEGVGAVVWTMAHPVWAAFYGDEGHPGPDEEGYVQPRNRPDRVERVNVHGCDLDRYVSWMAPVDRTERGVRLGAWEKLYDLPWTDAHGLVIDPMNEQLVRQRIGETTRRIVWDGGAPEGFWTPERLEALKGTVDMLLAVPDDPAAAREELKRLAHETNADDLMVTLGIFDRKEDGGLMPSRLLLEEAGLPELIPPVCTCGVEETAEARERYGAGLHAPDCPVGKRDREEAARG